MTYTCNFQEEWPARRSRGRVPAVCRTAPASMSRSTASRCSTSDILAEKPEIHMRRPFAMFGAGAGAFACLLLGSLGVAAGRDVLPADTVFINGKVFTADSRSAIVQAFAVKDDRFVAAGSNVAIRSYRGPATKIVDLHGRLVVPGLADGHLHNEGGGPGIDLSQARTLADLLSAVATAAKSANPGDLIVSNADWHEAQLKEKRLPLAQELDAAAPKNPVVLVRGGHSMILNTVALRKFNIARDTQQPEGGVIRKG